MATIYEQLGGAAAIDRAVDIFYRKVLQDDRISAFFDSVDMDAQIAKQKAFLTMVTGGPHAYTGRSMRDAHQRLLAQGLDDSHVDAVITHLGETLSELGAGAEQIAQVAGIANSVRDDILGRAKSA